MNVALWAEIRRLTEIENVGDTRVGIEPDVRRPPGPLVMLPG